TGDNHLDVVEKKSLGVYSAAGDLVPGVPSILEAILARMLARDPRQRYQTASELIIALERSQLAAQMLSFADPVLALKDPWVQAQLATDNQPTVLDVRRAPPEQRQPSNDEGRWLLRYRDTAGKLHRYRRTTE